MDGRGIDRNVADTFRLGYVSEPLPGDERYEGMLVIPYLTPTGPVALKFRNLRPDGEPRYLAPAGQETRLYNVMDLHKRSERIVICEGEIDTMTVSAHLPCVGVPGVKSWQSHYRRVFDGYTDVVILTDNDQKEDGSNPGQELAALIRREVRDSRNILLPANTDANAYVLQNGAEALLDLLGIHDVDE